MITFINIFTVLPERQQDALEAIQQVYVEVVSCQPGFISAKLLVSKDGIRVTAIATWETEADLHVLRHNPKFKDLHNSEFYRKIVSNEPRVYNSVLEISKREPNN